MRSRLLDYPADSAHKITEYQRFQLNICTTSFCNFIQLHLHTFTLIGYPDMNGISTSPRCHIPSFALTTFHHHPRYGTQRSAQHCFPHSPPSPYRPLEGHLRHRNHSYGVAAEPLGPCVQEKRVSDLQARTGRRRAKGEGWR
jgi:hypothetical protein